MEKLYEIFGKNYGWGTKTVDRFVHSLVLVLGIIILFVILAILGYS